MASDKALKIHCPCCRAEITITVRTASFGGGNGGGMISYDPPTNVAGGGTLKTPGEGKS